MRPRIAIPGTTNTTARPAKVAIAIAFIGAGAAAINWLSRQYPNAGIARELYEAAAARAMRMSREEIEACFVNGKSCLDRIIEQIKSEKRRKNNA